MTIIEQYWNSIAKRIALDFKSGEPKDWKKGEIKLFLGGFLYKLVMECKKNDDKAKRCGIPYVKGKFQYHQLNLSYDSFRRIFITGESQGNPSTKEMFAIYFGYDSVEDYIVQNNLKGTLEASVEQESAKDKNIETPKSKWKVFNNFWSIAVVLFFILSLFTKKNMTLLTNPIVLIGIALLLVFSIHRIIVSSGIIPPLDQSEGSSILKYILKYGFYIALLTIFLGAAIAIVGIFRDTNRTREAKKLVSEEVIANSSRTDRQLFMLEFFFSQLAPDSFDIEFNKKRENVLPAHSDAISKSYDRYILEDKVSSLRQARTPYHLKSEFGVSLVNNFNYSNSDLGSTIFSYQDQIENLEWAWSSLYKVLSSNLTVQNNQEMLQLARKTIFNRSMIIHLNGLRLVNFLNDGNSPRFNSSLDSLKYLTPKEVLSEAELLSLLEEKVNEAEEIMKERENILNTHVGLRDEALAKFEEEIEELTRINPEDTWNVVVGKAVSLRQFGKTTDAIAAFSRYKEMFAKTDPTATKYSDVAQLFTLKMNLLQVSGGVYIFNLKKDSQLDKAGLRLGDIIIEIDKQKVANMVDFSDLLKDIPSEQTRSVTYLRLGKDGGFKKETVSVSDLSRGGGFMPI